MTQDESQEPVERDWRKAPWGFGEKRLSTVEYSDIVSDGGLDPRNKFDAPPQRTEEPTKEMIDAAERIDWADSDVRGNIVNMWQAMSAVAPTTPPQRTWVGLTDEEICMFSMWLDDKPDATVFTAIEAKLKEKNND